MLTQKWMDPTKETVSGLCHLWILIMQFSLWINYICSLLHIGWHHNCSELLLLMLRLWTTAQHGSCVPRLAA